MINNLPFCRVDLSLKILFIPDFTVGFGVSPNQLLYVQFADLPCRFTAGQDLFRIRTHLALKIKFTCFVDYK